MRVFMRRILSITKFIETSSLKSIIISSQGVLNIGRLRSAKFSGKEIPKMLLDA